MDSDKIAKVKVMLRSGASIAATARKFGVCRQTIYNWINPHRSEKKQGRRPKLTDEQIWEIEFCINYHDPNDYNIKRRQGWHNGCMRWDGPGIAKLIMLKLGITVSNRYGQLIFRKCAHKIRGNPRKNYREW